jgi:hypothetical protein
MERHRTPARPRQGQHYAAPALRRARQLRRRGRRDNVSVRFSLPCLFGVCAATAFGQFLIEAGRLPSVMKYFDPQKNETALHCDVDPISPQLNFSLRFQAGYIVRVPANQFLGSGHRFRIIVKVLPEGNPAVYLASFARLPSIPRTNRKLELAGIYLVGEGRYSVDWVLVDDAGRICRKEWRMQARIDSSQRGLQPAMGAETVAEASFRRWSPQRDEADAPLRRITILLHAAPLVPNSTRLRPEDRILLLGSLTSLLESLPAQSVRVVVFNLDQQKELFRQDKLIPEAFPQMAQAMNEVQLQLVDYRVLEKARGHLDFVAALLNQEIQAQEPSDAVIFLGPPTRYFDNIPSTALDESSSRMPQFFYFQYKPYWRRAAELPDSIALAVKKLKGRVLLIHTPADFAHAIRQVRTQLVEK